MRSRIGDIRDETAVEAAVQEADPEVVLHLAAQALVHRSYEDPVGTYATNVMGTAHVLNAVRRATSARAVVVVTSDKCYDNREWWWPYRETDPLGGHDPYSSSKACAELVTAAWRRSYFEPEGATSTGVASVRAGNVVGGGDWAQDRLVPDCVRAFTDDRPVLIRRPHASRPWQHVLEATFGYLVLSQRLHDQPAAHADAWNFGPPGDDARTVGWVVDRLARTWGAGARWQRDGDSHPHEAGRLQVDASKARALLGWAPRLTVEEALDWTVEWYRRFGDGESAADLVAEQIGRFEALEVAA